MCTKCNFLTKVINNRAIEVANKMLSPIHNDFTKDRNILDGAVLLHGRCGFL